MNKKTGLVEALKSDNVHELLADGADAFIEVFSDSEVAATLPGIGTLVKTYKASKNIRERRRIRKLAIFLEHPTQMSEKEKQKFFSGFEDPSQEEEFGEQMLLLIEQSEDTVKPKVIGRLLVAHVRNHFDYVTLIRLCKMVNRAFSEDFGYLVNLYHERRQRRNQDIEQTLNAAGFLRQVGMDGGTMDGVEEGHVIYDVNVYGGWLVTLGLTRGDIPVTEEIDIEAFLS